VSTVPIRARRWITWVLAAELAVLAATGLFLHFRYRPDVHFAWDAFRPNDNSWPAADVARDLHRSASGLLLLTAVPAAVLAAWGPVARRRATSEAQPSE
jgi:hypothetical protein